MDSTTNNDAYARTLKDLPGVRKELIEQMSYFDALVKQRQESIITTRFDVTNTQIEKPHEAPVLLLM
jgi:hypothetical protein